MNKNDNILFINNIIVLLKKRCCDDFFDYKIILWNFKDDKDYIKRIKNSLGYKILSR